MARPIYLANQVPIIAAPLGESPNTFPSWTPRFLITTYETLALLTSGELNISCQFVNRPIISIPNEYPIAITIAEILIPVGNVFSEFSVWSTNPPTASNPPYANIAYTKNENIANIDVYDGFGELKKAEKLIGSAALNPFPPNTINAPTKRTMFALVTKNPPTEAIFEMLFKPFVDKYVITTINTTPRIANVLGAFKPNNDHVDVTSDPKIKLESGTQIDEDTLTIHTMYEANHMNVPTKANFAPTALSIQAYIPFSSLNAAPYSAIMNAYGMKNAIAPNKYHGIAEYPIK